MGEVRTQLITGNKMLIQIDDDLIYIRIFLYKYGWLVSKNSNGRLSIIPLVARDYYFKTQYIKIYASKFNIVKQKHEILYLSHN